MKLNVLDYIEQKRLTFDLNTQKELLIIQIGDENASNLYIKSKIKEAEKWNTLCTVIKFDKNVKDQDIIERINTVTTEKYFDGIIFQLPLVGTHDLKTLMQSTMTREQDVDGFFDNSDFIPCTPKGILSFLEDVYGIENKHIVVLGRGATVGGPLINILLKKKCTVTNCNSSTTEKQLKEILKTADIVISAVGKPDLFYASDLKKGSIVVDAGISRINGKQIGDFSHDGDLSKIDYTPWTNGVGKLTVASLMTNLRKEV